MRIGFTGASGTGKTTLAKAISEKLCLPMNPVGSRSTAGSMGFDNPYDVDKTDLETYSEAIAAGWTKQRAVAIGMQQYLPGRRTVRSLFQRELQRRKIEWETERDAFVTDRTTIDDFCYTAVHDVRAIDHEFMKNAIDHLSRYDLIFFTPMDSFINTANDPARMNDLAYHRTFETFAFGALMRWHHRRTHIYVVRQTELKDRIESVLSVIEMTAKTNSTR